MVWSSSWGKRVSRDIAPLLGLPQDLPYLRFGRGRPGGHSYKLPQLRKFLGELPAAVVDDEVGHDLKGPEPYSPGVFSSLVSSRKRTISEAKRSKSPR